MLGIATMGNAAAKVSNVAKCEEAAPDGGLEDLLASLGCAPRGSPPGSGASIDSANPHAGPLFQLSRLWRVPRGCPTAPTTTVAKCRTRPS